VATIVLVRPRIAIGRTARSIASAAAITASLCPLTATLVRYRSDLKTLVALVTVEAQDNALALIALQVAGVARSAGTELKTERRATR
jgi:ABC-type glucose/galactose transport system permease subunit